MTKFFFLIFCLSAPRSCICPYIRVYAAWCTRAQSARALTFNHVLEAQDRGRGTRGAIMLVSHAVHLRVSGFGRGVSCFSPSQSSYFLSAPANQLLWDACGPDCTIEDLSSLLQRSGRAHVNKTGPWVRSCCALTARLCVCLQYSVSIDILSQTFLQTNFGESLQGKKWSFQGCAPLHRAALYGKLDAMSALLAAGADIEVRTHVREDSCGGRLPSGLQSDL